MHLKVVNAWQTHDQVCMGKTHGLACSASLYLSMVLTDLWIRRRGKLSVHGAFKHRPRKQSGGTGKGRSGDANGTAVTNAGYQWLVINAGNHRYLVPRMALKYH